jgi:hypothetical protein
MSKKYWIGIDPDAEKNGAKWASVNDDRPANERMRHDPLDKLRSVVRLVL